MSCSEPQGYNQITLGCAAMRKKTAEPQWTEEEERAAEQTSHDYWEQRGGYKPPPDWVSAARLASKEPDIEKGFFLVWKEIFRLAGRLAALERRDAEQDH